MCPPEILWTSFLSNSVTTVGNPFVSLSLLQQVVCSKSLDHEPNGYFPRHSPDHKLPASTGLCNSPHPLSLFCRSEGNCRRPVSCLILSSHPRRSPLTRIYSRTQRDDGPSRGDEGDLVSRARTKQNLSVELPLHSSAAESYIIYRSTRFQGPAGTSNLKGYDNALQIPTVFYLTSFSERCNWRKVGRRSRTFSSR